MDLEAAKKVINSPAVQKYIEKMDKDARKAVDVMKKNLSDMKDFPKNIVSEYKGHGASLEKDQQESVLSMNLVVFGKAKDGKALISSYKRYVESLLILEEDNSVYSAVVDARLAATAAEL